MMDHHKEAFKEEAYELLSDLEESLLELERAPDDEEVVGKVFRAMHTIKGSGAMFGFDDIAEFTHEIETVYDKVRSGQVLVSKELISLTLGARDMIKTMLEEVPGEPVERMTREATMAAFRKLALMPEEPLPARESRPSAPPDTKPDTPATYRIRFKPSPSIFATGTNPLLLLDELEALGECTIVALLNDVPRLEDIDPERCYAAWDIVLTTDKGINAVRDVFIFVEDECDIRMDEVQAQPEGDHRLLGEILVERGDITGEDLEAALQEKKYLGEILVEKGATTVDRVESALVEQQHAKKVKEKAQTKEDAISSIRVPADKLDALVNLVGELVTTQARLSQIASVLGNADVTAVAEEVEHLTAELRDNTLNIRMLPIGTTFGRFKRLIRDLSQELGKEIEMTTGGAETELDKTVIEKLSDPLVHIIRNSIDHGIELPEARLRAGKPRAGNIHLSARHSGASVIIEIADDGKGLDKDAILTKAMEKGLATPGADLSDREIFNFVFVPGFSTAKEVTNVSGRGVGMDVVRKAIDALGGSIDMLSEKGKGTTVLVKLPLTLAIVDGLLVRIAEDHFVLPLSLVEECVELTREDAARAHGRDIANIRGSVVPYIRLRKEFNIPGESPAIEQIVVAGINGERVGFVVDSVIGDHHTVIKNLGKLYSRVDAISGATILGNGKVALIVDAPKLARSVELAQAAHG